MYIAETYFTCGIVRPILFLINSLNVAIRKEKATPATEEEETLKDSGFYPESYIPLIIETNNLILSIGVLHN